MLGFHAYADLVVRNVELRIKGEGLGLGLSSAGREGGKGATECKAGDDRCWDGVK